MKYKKIILVCSVAAAFYVLFLLTNSYFSWYGYEPWKYRHGSYGDKSESVKRKAFITDLNYETNLNLKYFKVYLEKGYWYGSQSAYETRFAKGTKYPYQVSLTVCDTIHNGVFSVVNSEKFDSIENEPFNVCIYLKKPYLNDTLLIKIANIRNNDSIGYVKIWSK